MAARDETQCPARAIRHALRARPAHGTAKSSLRAIVIGSDHAGSPLKTALQAALEGAGQAVLDFGSDSPASVNYPVFAHAACAAVTDGRARLSVLVCGSGIDMAIPANRHPAIRAAVLHETTEARLTRAHNDANVACFGARMTGEELALDALQAVLETPFEGCRHQRRVDKIAPV
jgi:ribose 5-phosphate isomerase B